MFYKGDSVYLYIVDFGSEFNGFGFLASDNGAKVMPVSYTHLPSDKTTLNVSPLGILNLCICTFCFPTSTKRWEQARVGTSIIPQSSSNIRFMLIFFFICQRWKAVSYTHLRVPYGDLRH